MRRFKNTKKIRGTHPRRNNNLNNAGVRSRVFHEAVEIQDPFQDDLWLISLKPQLASLKQVGFQPLNFTKII